ncbi:MAG: PfkB family carbohydrate kinase, partial [Elusimicrobiota bacterium]
NVLGAGDAFLSGYLSGWIENLPAAHCGRRGNAAGAIVVTRHGCTPAMPTRAELDDFMGRAPTPARPDEDTRIAALHRAPTVRPLAGDLCVLAFDHRRQLEQIFFHDVLNTASGVQGLLHVMQEADADVVQEAAVQKYLPIARRASDTLIDELLCQRDMTAAENGKLSVTREELSTLGLLTDLTKLFERNSLAMSRTIVVAPGSEDLRLTTDKTLLSRVLVNLIKNALEAVPHGGTVTVTCRRESGAAVFLVHNSSFMPPEVQHQLFQRSYSTKGVGRGFGTYSIRLLTENYLGGKVSFTSDPAQGTTFRAEYPLAP